VLEYIVEIAREMYLDAENQEFIENNGKSNKYF